MTATASPSTVPSPRQHDSSPTRTRRAQRTDEIVEAMRCCTDDELFGLQQELIDLNVEVARSIASRYQNRGVALEDLEQVALLALTKSARRFDAQSGHAFLSFCVPTIRGEVRRYFRDHGWMVRPPRSIQELQYRVSQARAELTAPNGQAPTEPQLAEHLHERLEDVREALDGKGSFSPASLDRPTGVERDGSPLGELIPMQGGEQDSSEARVVLAPVVRRLGERDRRILSLRFFEGLTQREIADDIGVTQMQVSRLLTRIYRDLREEIGEIPDLAQ